MEVLNLSTEVNESLYDSAIIDSFGVLYSPNKELLIGTSSSFNCTTYAVRKGTKVICDWAFSDCKKLGAIKIPNSVIKIGHGSFFNCGNLNEIQFSRNIFSIGDKAFYNCIKLSKISLPHCIEEIGDLCFFQTSIEKIILPCSLRSIKGNPFGRKDITVPVEIKSLSSYFIVDNNNLYTYDGRTLISFQQNCKSFTIPNHVIEIGRNAFHYNKNIGLITISPNVKIIQSNPFVGTNIILIINKSPSFVISDEVLYTQNYETLIYCFSKSKIIRINSPVKNIGEYAFKNNNTCRKISLPNTVLNICDSAFAFCSKIEVIQIPDSVQRIADNAFRGCEKLSEIEMPLYVESCGKHLFRGCTSLQKVKLPQKMNDIEAASFMYCKQIEKIVIPYGVSKIGTAAFEYCTKLTNIVLPNSIISIGRGAFFCCNSLTNIVIPNSVKYIGIAAFRHCKNLTTLYIPESVEHIGKYAFENCVARINSRVSRFMHIQNTSIRLIATPIGNGEHLKTLLPVHFHNIIQELSYEEFMKRSKSIECDRKSEKYSADRSLKQTKCPRCGDWYYEDSGVCDTCGYPWNE